MVSTRRTAVRRSAAAAAQVLENDDLMALVAQHVLRTHDLTTYSAFRLTSSSLLAAWKQNFTIIEPWLHVWPVRMDHELFRICVCTEIMQDLGRKTRANKELHERYEYRNSAGGSEWDGAMKTWHALRVRAERYVHQLLSQSLDGSPLCPPERIRSLLPAPDMPLPAHSFSLSDFRLHVSVVYEEEEAPRHGYKANWLCAHPYAVFAGSVQLSTPETIPADGNGSMHANGFRVPNSISVQESGLARLANDNFRDTLDVGITYGVDGVSKDIYASVHLSRSDGAVTSLSRTAMIDSSTKSSLVFALGIPVPFFESHGPPERLDELQTSSGDDDAIHIQEEVDCFRLDVNLKSIRGINRSHPQWNEGLMAEQYEMLRDDLCDEKLWERVEMGELCGPNCPHRAAAHEIPCPVCKAEHHWQFVEQPDDTLTDEQSAMLIVPHEAILHVDPHLGEHEEQGQHPPPIHDATVVELLMRLPWAAPSDPPDTFRLPRRIRLPDPPMF